VSIPTSLDRVHVCSAACGIVFDPLCPQWYPLDRDGKPIAIPAPAFEPETFARLLSTLLSPAYRPALRIVLRELLADDVANAVAAAMEADE
jgi:hypothetical protein